ncbi:MAG TPA: hypothetical protein P5175_03105 [Anaerohalosphaeraceae bacterium]|nr:hypothetical protein [Anaerohalosphaeraceae bacterium]HOM76422.1 hypothetical protein [Anaerohalosphaeraceae bacterium]HPC63589.1 hypothetical protein [Anaerohalosphaeraceae bacterium]HPO70926.1 hypothetical protein [Anaerohalosphaeraceae bacterium]HRS70819.1 hypothetical protein [Anaerohalosphaeraceae bacterium]
MQERNDTYITYRLLTGLGIILFAVAGCRDNPETKAAKAVRKQTAEAVRVSATEKDYPAAQQKVMAALVQNRTGGLTQDAALLASGTIALANGRQMQSDLGLKTLPLNQCADNIRKTLRRLEQLLLEKKRIEGLLAGGDLEVAELKKLLVGDAEHPGLQAQLEQANEQLSQLLSQKQKLQEEKNKVQAVLDEQQAQADALLRKAEMARGDEKLSLQQQAYAVLLQRKDFYVQAQAAENAIKNLDADTALVQVRIDGIKQSIEQVGQKAAAIEASAARVSLKQQMADIEREIAVYQQSLTALADKLKNDFSAYQETADRTAAIFEEASAEFEKIHSNDAQFSAAIGLAESAHRAALAGEAPVKIQLDLARRLQNMTETADPNFAGVLQSRLSLPLQVQPEVKQKILALYDRAIENYEKALAQASRFGSEAECSLLKSLVIASHDKMKFADLCQDFDLANAAETAMMALIQKGTEKGVCFTQSEVLKIIESEGLNYLPSMPLNMEVFIEGKRQELSAWKRLPISQQEAAVNEALPQIDALITQYGQQMADALEPLKQEMLAAKERGFKEPVPAAGGPGEPNSLF